MELRDITMADLSLYEALLTDLQVMSELGGPLPRDGLEEKLRGIVDDVEAENIWYFVIAADGADAGTLCIWPHEWRGQPINEMGWMLLPRFQGRGLASEAVRQTLDRARSEGRWDVIHAFPGVTNGPSNGICRKFGFSNVEDLDFDYAGRSLRVNHWVLDLSR